MNRSKLKIIKLGGYDLAQLVDKEVSLNHKVKHSCDMDDNLVYIISVQENGDNTYDEDRISIETDLLMDYVSKRYGITESISRKAELEGGLLIFTFLISNGASTGDREPAASSADSDGSQQAKARPRIGRPKRVGQKLSVLSDNVHSGV